MLKRSKRQRSEDYFESDITPAVGGAILQTLAELTINRLQVYCSPVLAHKRISAGFLSILQLGYVAVGYVNHDNLP